MIVVTGMHRSGTSLVSQLLSELGVDFGDSKAFYCADQWNEKGYFETRQIVDANSRLITGVARTDGSLAAALSQIRYLAMPNQDVINRRSSRMKHLLKDAVHGYGNKAVKDPRFCLTLKHWQEVVELDKLVVCLRHPFAVAQSLKRRQHIPLWLGYRFWNYHLTELLKMLPLDRTVFVDFERLQSHEGSKELLDFSRFLGLSEDREILSDTWSKTFCGDLVHAGQTDVPELPMEVQDTWNELLNLARQ